MLIDTLDTIAKAYKIPDKEHSMLHVNSRECWIDLVYKIVDSGLVDPKKKTIQVLAKNWETILYNKYSLLN